MLTLSTRMLRWPLGVCALAAVTACAGRTVTTSGGEVVAVYGAAVTRADVDALIAAWPAKPRETANMLIAKYGVPTVAGDRELVWYNTGPFIRTALSRDEAPHNFPMPHTDYLAQTVKHSVPVDRVDDLVAYDGSAWYHRTRGELSAQCDKEEMNFLALNLAHDVITGRRSVSDARTFYARTAMEFKQGKTSAYTSGLIFSTEPNSADLDRELKP